MRTRPFRRSHGHRREPQKPWYEQDGGTRLARYQEIITEHFPGLTFEVTEEKGVRLTGSITLRSDCGVPRDIGVLVTFPVDHPRREPRAYDQGCQFDHIADRHFHPDGRCCLWLDCETGWRADDPDVLFDFLVQVALFFDRQLDMDARPACRAGVWPGPERNHGHLGYLQLVQEKLGDDAEVMGKLARVFARCDNPGRNEPCPCGSGRKYKACHIDTVTKIRSDIGEDKVRELFRDWAPWLEGRSRQASRQQGDNEKAGRSGGQDEGAV